EERYRGRLAAADCTAGVLRAALDEYEEINRLMARPLAYASLRFSADTTDPARGALLQRMQVESTAITRHLVFFDLEIGRMPAETFDRLIGDEAVAPYRHYLQRERQAARHHLSEPEEQIVQELGNTGVRAFNRLFSEITSRVTFRVRAHGEEKELNQSEVLALLYDPDRELRKAAAAAITETLRQNAHVLTFIFNNLLLEKQTMDRLRRYDYAEQSRHEDNELTPEIVQNVVDVCAASYDVVADYYGLKRRLLGIDELTHYDRYAPLTETGTEIPFGSAEEMVLGAFGEFSGPMREMTEPFFHRRWIDAELRPGKRGGAFCSYITPDLHPFVFMNYTNKARDVMTLAHELGHAIHGVLASRQNFLEFYPSLALAETASVFGEMLVFEKLQAQLQDPREKLALLCGKIEDSFATVYRQATMYRFEQAAHAARRTEGELPTERYNALWQNTMQEMFGDSLTLGEEHAWWWLYIPHIFASPFYVYAYSFGELLVMALYARYKQEGEPFVQRYLDLLAAGGSRRPQDLLAELGIDITRKEFWQGGIDLIRGLVQQANSLAEEVAG
ncbi:MAG TPA: M3 family oligoendopeptidase, partial [Armatimonadota bacterium]|nr:M3 family oligoendopeptidase [Armatimonadota bacterium]